MTTVRETVGNRRFAGVRPTLVVGPVEIPGGVEGVRERMRTFAREGPQTRVGLVPDRSSSHWQFDADCAYISVSERSAPEALDVAAELIRIGESPAAPIRVEVVGDHIVAAYDHGLGDGMFIVDLIAALTLRETAGFPGLRRTTPIHVTRHPVVRSLSHHLHTRPRAVVDAAISVARSVLSASDAPPAPSRVVSDGHSTVEYAASTPGYVSRVREVRDRFHPGASVVGVVTYLIGCALRDAGIPLARNADFMVNLRRYLPTADATTANFLGATHAPLDSPTAITTSLRAATRGGDLLVHQAAADTLAWLRPARLAEADQFREVSTREVTLVISDLTPHPAIDTIVWKDVPGSSPVFAIVSASRATDQINVVLNRARDDLQVTACFVEGAFDRAVIRSALEAALADSTLSAMARTL